MRKVAICLLIAGALWAIVSAEEKAKDQQVAELGFLVLKDDNGKPIRNASIVLHQVDGRGRQAKGGLELKTDAEGKTSLNGVPFGKLRVQVIAPGFQTYGADHDVHQPQQEIVIKLKRPQEQYTIYK
jgi:hypothetical protein